jgi:hypothetical protein
MRDYPQHVVDVCVAVLFFEHHPQHLFGLLEFSLGVVFTAEDKELLHALVQRATLLL